LLFYILLKYSIFYILFKIFYSANEKYVKNIYNVYDEYNIYRILKNKKTKKK